MTDTHIHDASSSTTQKHPVEDRRSTNAEITYEVVRREGEHESSRETRALAWSGLAGGLSMSFSFVAMAMLHHSLPGASWAPLVEKLGYSVGFLIVTLGAQQLFTENTLNAVVPALVKSSVAAWINVGRIWFVVLVANMIGSLLFTMLLAWTQLFDASHHESLLAVARESLRPEVGATFVKAIVAGWLIALMIWMLPGAEQSKLWVIVIMTWLVGVAELSHIVAGASETLYLVLRGEASVAQWFTQFFFPTLAGNIAGGTLMVAALNHAQVNADKNGEGEHEVTLYAPDDSHILTDKM